MSSLRYIDQLVFYSLNNVRNLLCTYLPSQVARQVGTLLGKLYLFVIVIGK